MKVLGTIKRFLARLRKRKTSYKNQYRLCFCETLPDKLDQLMIYLEGEDEDQWTAAFRCPCGCAEIIHLNLLNDNRPNWKVTKKEPVNITPSIRKTNGCRSHFFIRHGRVQRVNGSSEGS